MTRFLPLRWVIVCLSLSLGACGAHGGEQDNSGARPGDGEEDAGTDDRDGGPDEPGETDGAPWWEATDSGSGGHDADANEGTPDSGRTCKTACDADDCGESVSDQCGGFLKCRVTCPEGQGCGLLRPDKCDAPPSSCTPTSAAAACQGKCGIVSDGCSAVFTCSAANGGISCGVGERCVETEGDSSRNTCVVTAPSCVALTCAQQNVACGLTGDGCGNVLNCTVETGGCGTDKVCGTGANSGKCVDPPPPACVPMGIATACANTCGRVDDGCGTEINCESSPLTACPNGQTCGGGGTPGRCGSGTVCTPSLAATACAGKCGTVGDGCGGSHTCSLSNGGDTCDGNVGEECIQGTCVAPVCTPRTTDQACPVSGGHKSCGQQPNGCSGTIDCGGCAADEACGLGGPSLCGALPVCQPASCAGKCGTMADGCGSTVTCTSANGGTTCTGAEFCGATQANRCGTPPVTCTPRTCADLGHTCGLATDGCGHQLNCWAGCSPSDPNCVGTCGTNNACLSNGAGVQGCVMGTPTCVGSLCNTVPTSCGASAPTRLTGTVRTPGRQVSGSWLNQLPVPNAIVYIPADPAPALPSIFEGVAAGNPASCGRCEDEKLVADGQSVLAAAVTNYRGEFTLEGRIPVGSAFELVIKIGKWRRVVQVPAGIAQACASSPLALEYTRLNRNSTDGASGTHLPKIAVSTGRVDEMECVFRGIGIDEAEFSVPSGGGRLHMYRANGARMRVNTGVCSGNHNPPGPPPSMSCTSALAPVNGDGCTLGLSGCSWVYNDVSVADSDLFATQASLNQYDLVVWDCEGGQTFELNGVCSNNSARACTANSGCRVCSNDSARACTANSGCQNGGTCGGSNTCVNKPTDRVRDFVDAGGRMFASHYSYVWIENNGTLDQSADWNGSNETIASGTGYVSLPSGSTQRTRANPVKSLVLRDWLDWQGELSGTVDGMLTNPTTPQFTIEDPRDHAGPNVGSATDEWVYRNVRYCSNNSARACTDDAGCRVCSNDSARACAANGDCQNGGTCGGSNTCLAPLSPRVQQLSFNTPYNAAESAICGRVAYSAFHVSNSDNDDSDDFFPGICDNGELNAQEKILAFMLFDLATCVSTGDPPQPPSCQPKTTANVCPGENDACGFLADGCGGVVDCAGCSAGFYCDGSTCRLQQCTPATCASLGYNCGLHADGCGGIARNAQGAEGCGECTGGQLCGLGGPGLCGSSNCTPIPAATACPANSCGTVSNGCGGTYNCGTCPSGQVCGAQDPNRCGTGVCVQTPRATACNNRNCGIVSDGCGGSYDCGVCEAPDTCGGGGQADLCGHPQCTPFTRDQACNGKQCGWVSDGCGGAIQCGTCPNGGVCGGNGPNLCGTSCTVTSCTAQAAQCGAISDQCGGVLSCGNCPPGQICGAGGPNKCGTGQMCTARTCAQAGAQCGLVGDGCGNVLDCGMCTGPGQTCGGAGQANQCGTGTGGCNKLTCAVQSVQCGAASDGCGGLLDCGGCGPGYTCERSACEELPPPVILL